MLVWVTTHYKNHDVDSKTQDTEPLCVCSRTGLPRPRNVANFATKKIRKFLRPTNFYLFLYEIRSTLLVVATNLIDAYYCGRNQLRGAIINYSCYVIKKKIEEININWSQNIHGFFATKIGRSHRKCLLKWSQPL